ncbi:DUF2339 domain-containing protein [Helicobacter canis]|uniref:DUF2339 domain-containing protein n=1 Tax=Helicobacter canis NCTC 12740 TaxID=1357399 RepID=V8CHZ3_9HELI|nr:DUF2339 domain-containing protein [Helicobacter canis]ETD26645.1 hypothetical protein HMPREF2087_01030 [Helicobacter canis NCTC 12740]
MELVVVLVIIFIVFLFVGAVYGFIAHSKARQIARDLELAHSKLGRVMARLEKLESSFSLSPQADKIGAAIHAQQKGEKVDSSQSAASLENKGYRSALADVSLEVDFHAAAHAATRNDKKAVDCHATASTLARNDSTNTAHNGAKVDSKRSWDSSPQAQSLAKDSSKPQSTAHPSTQPTPKFQRLLQTFTQNSLALLGGIFFILAAFFLVNYSINHSLITPQVRIGLSLAFGVLLLACGILSTLYQHTLARKLQRLSIFKQPSIIAQTCIGAGLVVEFLAVYGGYYFYRFFGLTGAFALLALIAVFALILTLRYGVVIGIFGVLGSFSTPVLLASGAYHATMLFVYVLVCYFFALSIAIRSRQLAIFLIANVFVLGYMLDFVLLREVGKAGLVLLVFVVVALLGAHSAFALMHAPTLSTSEQASSQKPSNAMSLWRNALGLSLALSALVLCAGIAGLFSRLGYMDFGTLELAFLAFITACLFALPALTRFARYPISPLYLSLPIPFSVLMLCFVIKAAGASTLVALGFMVGIAAGLYVYVRFRDLACGLESACIDLDCHAENNARNDAKGTSSAKVDSSPQAQSLAKDSSAARMRVWYLWLMSFSAMCFLLLSTQIACLDWIESAGKYAMWILGLGVFGWVYRAVVVYRLTPYRDVLLLASSFGALCALGFIGDDLLRALPRTMRVSLLWLASGVLLALLGRARILPREISGFEWVFAGFGLLATWAHIVGIDLLYGLFGSLRGSYLPELCVFMLISAINLWLFARAVDSPAASLSASLSTSLSTSRRGIFAALSGLLLWETIALINLCAFWILRHWFIGFDDFFMRNESLSRTLAVCAVFVIAFGALTISSRARTKQNLAQQSQLANHSSRQNPLHQNPLWIKFYTHSSLVLFVYGLVVFCSLLLSYKGYTYAYAAVEMDMLQASNQLFVAIIAQVAFIGLAGVQCLCYTKSLATSWHAQGAKDTKDSSTFARFSLQLIANTAALVGIVGALVYAIRLCFAGRGDISFGDMVVGDDRSLLYEFGSAGFGEIELYTYSIALVLLGIIMLAGYFISRYKVYKIYAFVLFGAATLKVFFIDTSRLNSLAKIVLFVCMGALFLLISYVYSKYVSGKERG